MAFLTTTVDISANDIFDIVRNSEDDALSMLLWVAQSYIDMETDTRAEVMHMLSHDDIGRLKRFKVILDDLAR